MALPHPAALAAALITGALGLAAGAPARAEEPAVAPAPQAQPAPGATPGVVAPEAVDTSLSPECRVPGSKLYTIASLRGVKKALKEQRAIHVLAIGSSSTVGVGASSPLASYPVRLEDELTRLFPDVEVVVENRGVSGEVASGAAERMRAVIADVEPDLVVWQVGTNDALARIDVADFKESMTETIRWIKSHDIDVVLVDPQYTASLAKDDYYTSMVGAVQEVAGRERAPLVQRYEAMRYLADRATGAYLSRDQFHLNDLGYRCMAEHVARAITVSLLQPDPGPTTGTSAPQIASGPGPGGRPELPAGEQGRGTPPSK